MRILPLAVVFLLGCHGSELRFGVGRDWNEFDGSGSSGYRDDESSSFSFEQDDTTRGWVELAFQLTPSAVVLKKSDAAMEWPSWNEGIRGLEIPDAPLDGDDHEHVLTRAEVEALLAARESGYITWKTLTGSGAVGGGGLAGLGYLLHRRTRRAIRDHNGGPGNGGSSPEA